ncbi:glutamate ligase domain-containing protein, partial [Bifidobacterium longum subsp. infantis]
ADHVTHARRAVIMCVDDAGALAVLRSLAPEDARKVIAYSTHTADELGDLNGATFVHIASEHESANSGTENFVIDIPAALVGADVALPVSLRIPGLHNARNATAAILAAVLLGMDAERAAVAAGTFLGANRRFQIRGTVSDITVVDDYAHHPTEITALLKAARRRYPD